MNFALILWKTPKRTPKNFSIIFKLKRNFLIHKLHYLSRTFLSHLWSILMCSINFLLYKILQAHIFWYQREAKKTPLKFQLFPIIFYQTSPPKYSRKYNQSGDGAQENEKVNSDCNKLDGKKEEKNFCMQ